VSVVAVPGGGDDESTIYIEVDTVPEVKPGWGNDDVRNRAAERAVAVARDILGEGVELAKSCARRFTEGLNELGEDLAPDEIELQLGITLDAEFGAMVAKTKAGAQVQVTMRWRRP